MSDELDALNRAYVRDRAFEHLRERGSRYVPGEGPPAARLMVIGRCPGRSEDSECRPFAGRAGSILDRLLSSHAGVERDQCYVTNVLKYRPIGPDPDPDDWLASRRYASAEIIAVEPTLTVLVGEHVYNMVFPDGELDADHGVSQQMRGRWYIPVFLPDLALSGGQALEALRKDFAAVGQELRIR